MVINASCSILENKSFHFVFIEISLIATNKTIAQGPASNRRPHVAVYTVCFKISDFFCCWEKSDKLLYDKSKQVNRAHNLSCNKRRIESRDCRKHIKHVCPPHNIMYTKGREKGNGRFEQKAADLIWT